MARPALAEAVSTANIPYDWGWAPNVFVSAAEPSRFVVGNAKCFESSSCSEITAVRSGKRAYNAVSI
jgi:hypothetical protein